MQLNKNTKQNFAKLHFPFFAENTNFNKHVWTKREKLNND